MLLATTAPKGAKENKMDIKKYENKYGNIFINDIPKELTYIKEKRLQPFLKKNNIPYLDVVVSFSKYGAEKEGVAVFENDVYKINEYLEAKKKKAPNIEKAKINRKKKQEKIKQEKKEEFDALEFLKKNLRNIEEAHPEWMKDAIDACDYSYKNEGVIWQFLETSSFVNEDAYTVIRMAVGAHRRHTKTDYEEVLLSANSRGASYEEIKMIREEYRC